MIGKDMAVLGGAEFHVGDYNNDGVDDILLAGKFFEHTFLEKGGVDSSKLGDRPEALIIFGKKDEYLNITLNEEDLKSNKYAKLDTVTKFSTADCISYDEKGCKQYVFNNLIDDQIEVVVTPDTEDSDTSSNIGYIIGGIAGGAVLVGAGAAGMYYAYTHGLLCFAPAVAEVVQNEMHEM